MIEWLAGIAILGGYTVYKKYRSDKKVLKVLNKNSDAIDNAISDIESIEENESEYFNYKKLSDWSIKHKSVIETIKSIEPKRLKKIAIKNTSIHKMVTIIENNVDYRETFNKRFIEKEMTKYKLYFDECLKDKKNEILTYEQREAIVKDEDINYINAGAGTGKTTTILAKVKYLVQKKDIDQNQILLLAYNKVVADYINDELKKYGLEGVTASTVHALGNSIVKEKYQKTNKDIPDVFSRDDNEGLKILDNIFFKLRNNTEYFKRLIEYFLYFLNDYKPGDTFDNLQEYVDYLAVNKPITIMGETVKSQEEVFVANTLFKWGIKYEYEKPYKHKLDDNTKKTYSPDFYLTDFDIYLEHFALNRVENEDGSYSLLEFFKGYKKQHDEKLVIHKSHDTKLIKTYSFQIKDETFVADLKKSLEKYNIKVKSISNEEILNQLKKTSDFKIKLFTKLCNTFLSHYKSNLASIEELKTRINDLFNDTYSRKRAKRFLSLFRFFLDDYEKYLESNNLIDFEDMINIASKEIDKKSDDYYSYKYIFVDEFQDITIARHKMLKGLMHKSSYPKLLVVGDDWQSIYKFAGGEIDILMNFKKYYGEYFSKSFLTETFRFGNGMANLTNKFIRANPNQEQKVIRADETIREPCRFIQKPNMNDISTISKTLQFIERYSRLSNKVKPTNVLVLNRYKKNRAKKYATLIRKYKKNKYVNFQFKTIHSSKGLTFDFVLLDDVSIGKLGFPSNVTDDSILQLFLNNTDEYPYSEERRLFYVSMTRAIKRVYVFYHRANASSFVQELHKNEGINCKSCGSTMVLQPGENTFFWCQNFPRLECDYKVWEYTDYEKTEKNENYKKLKRLISTKEF